MAGLKSKKLRDRDKELMKNGSGCYDPTAYLAIKNVENSDDADRFHEFIHSVFDLCESYDFHLEGRIVVKDRQSGRIWR